MLKKLVSIILPSYNHEFYLKQRLNSIFNQTYQGFELIILDDCSTDQSLKILEVYKNHPKVSHFIVNEENSGSPFKQWQKGLNLAKGDYIWIAESDDYCDLDFLEKQVNELDNSKVDVVVAKTILVNQQAVASKEANHHIFSSSDQNILEGKDILKIPILNVSSMCFRSSMLKQTCFYSNFNIIGDRVFYQEHFLNGLISKNNHTRSYFRRTDDALSNFDKKSLKFKSLFFKENLNFIRNEFKLGHVEQSIFNQYLKKFFQKVKNRTSRKEKLGVAFFKIWLSYKSSLK